MEDEEGEDSCALKRRKKSSGFTICDLQRGTETRDKRSLSLSLKTTRTKKKRHESILEILRSAPPERLISKKDDLGFCPACQAPFFGLVGQSAQVHVQQCLEEKEKATVMCPDGINCNFTSPQHFKKFSHQQLADLHSIKVTKQHISTNEEQVEKQSKCSSESKHENRIKGYSSSYSEKGDSLTLDIDASSTLLSFKISDTCSDEHEMTFKDNMDTTLELSQKECTVYSISDECDDEISQWLNDDLKYEDFELLKDVGGSMDSAHNSDSSSSHPCRPTSQNIAISTDSKSRPIVDLLTGHKKETGAGKAMKQMDIGIFFGLKPKLNTELIGIGIPASTDMTTVSQSSKQHNNERETSWKATHQKCPFYKIVEGTSFVVDAFCYGNIPRITAYFLSHFHYDHYCGLKKSFSHPIYCSQATANLISLKIKVATQFIHPLPLHKTVHIQNVEVTLLDANHCPGAVMFIFKLPNGKTHLHTGDFRASPLMEENPFLRSSHIHTLYLDTTYCDPDYSFPPQSDTVNYCASLASKAVAKNPKTLIVVGTYTIGKEKIFIAVADALKCKVGVRADKHNILQCLESKHQNEIITRNYKDAQVHVLPMANLSHKKLALHHKDYSSLYCEILAIKPTGWTYKDCESNLATIKPSKRGPVAIYGIPYSEHSSYKELERFVKFIKPYKIIPTVNNGSATKRDEMNKVFKMWLMK